MVDNVAIIATFRFMEPAQTVIAKLRGPANVAAITGVHRTRPYDWMKPRSEGGTDGIIPQRHHRSLLDWARENGIALAAEEFLPPRPATSEPERAA